MLLAARKGAAECSSAAAPAIAALQCSLAGLLAASPVLSAQVRHESFLLRGWGCQI